MPQYARGCFSWAETNQGSLYVPHNALFAEFAEQIDFYV
jgi:hypothetical protein